MHTACGYSFGHEDILGCKANEASVTHLHMTLYPNDRTRNERQKGLSLPSEVGPRATDVSSKQAGVNASLAMVDLRYQLYTEMYRIL